VLNVTVDLADLDFVDSSGLQVLVAGLKRVRGQGGDLGLRAPKPSTRKFLEITALTSIFRLEEAISAPVLSTPSPVRAPDHAGRPMTGERSQVAVD